MLVQVNLLMPLLVIIIVIKTSHQYDGNGTVSTTLTTVLYLKGDHERPSVVMANTTCNHSNSLGSYTDNSCSLTSYPRDSCPTWFICNNKGKCHCGPEYKDYLKCDDKNMVSSVLNCRCVTKIDNETYLGSCFYNCERPLETTRHLNIYHEISDKTDLNKFICGRFNRTGISCGQCTDNTSPLVLSYNLSCVHCPDGYKNWWKFVVFGFVPLTVFYFFVVFFNINVTSSRMHGFILFSQALSTPAFVRIILLAAENVPILLTVLKFAEPLYSLWNLDIFRSILPDICLNVGTLEMFALDACLAVYPLLLIIVSYLLIELYDRNVYCIVFIWKPFRLIFRLFRENWDIRTSVIDSFATFFLLSYVKVMSVLTDLLLFTPVYELHSNKPHYRVYYDSNVKFLSFEHMPFVALSTVLFIVFIAVPTAILMLYPFCCFQKCLSYLNIRSHVLHAFIDSFQGCYKDGTEPGTYDLRWFSSYGLVLRFCICTTFALTLSSMFFIYVVIVIIIMIILLINLQPYKTAVTYYTKIDASFLILLSLFYIAISGIDITILSGQSFLKFFYGLAFIASIIPIIYATLIVLHWIYSKWKRARWMIIIYERMKNDLHI